MGWLVLLVLMVIIPKLAVARECGNCGARKPDVPSHLWIKTLCDDCWLIEDRSRDTPIITGGKIEN